MIGIVIYGSFSQSFRVRDHATALFDRYHDVRSAMTRMTREISSAYISAHHHAQDPTTATCFKGERDNLTLVTMAHLRLVRDSKESDQAEVSYFLKKSETLDGRSVTNLMRREDTTPDDNVEKGGRSEVLAEDVRELRFEYWEPEEEIGDDAWTNEWEVGSCKASEPPSADDKTTLPMRVRITLVVRSVDRKKDLKFVTQAPIMLQQLVDF